MVWELVGIVVITIGTLVWFVSDERRRRNQALERSARFFARAPRYRHVTRDAPLRVVPTARELNPRRGLSKADLDYFEQLTGKN